jgi:hypothetical protein
MQSAKNRRLEQAVDVEAWDAIRRSIAEGNHTDAEWQALYGRLRAALHDAIQPYLGVEIERDAYAAEEKANPGHGFLGLVDELAAIKSWEELKAYSDRKR